MEQILWLYALPYDPAYPVVCFDERPCFLIDEVLEPLAMQTGQVRKEHYAYEKRGSCALLAAIEPLTGQRLAQVYVQRTKKEFTLFCQKLAATYDTAAKIRLVLDNLNTHTTGAFYDHLPADEAFVYMMEIELSALTRLCFNRRIPTLEKLETEVLAIVAERTQQKIKINWQFSLALGREKLNRHYTIVHGANTKFKKVE